MKEGLYLKSKIKIEESAEVVWQALTDPQITPLYMYGCEVLFEPTIGAEIVWKGKSDGLIYVKGTIAEITPTEKLKYSVLDPDNPHGDTEDQCLYVTYNISSVDKNSCILRVSQGDFSQVNNGKDRFEKHLAEPAWPSILEKLKSIVEEE